MRLRKRIQCFPSCSSLRKVDEDENYRRRKKCDEELEWPHNSTHVKPQLAQCFINAMVGPRSWTGLFTRSSNKRNEKPDDYSLSPLQEQRLLRLQARLQVPFDENRPDHQEALKALWHAAFPDVALRGLISEQWKEMGWQGSNPSTDFSLFSYSEMLSSGAAVLSPSRTCFFSPGFIQLLFKRDGNRATWEYPFAVAGINISFMLIKMLDLCSEKPRCLPGINFVKLLGEDEAAFDVLYCIAFEMVDAQWLAMHASYMQFNEVLQATRTQLERELSLEDTQRIHDLPAYNLLYQ
ncbi:ELMO domain-containing protein B isoform X2 [Pyrus x bretschneideri]|uniref:ELMO domain-containing protein B isoform X2 n=1 Tax=Pyrus x bretschneideri TaxID=225117 RepID=UPI0008706766|nr:ELMO domain-containing protein B isoform X2 [Pyrus x bretschneideri]